MGDLFKGTKGKIVLLVATALILIAESYLDRTGGHEATEEALHRIELLLEKQLTPRLSE